MFGLKFCNLWYDISKKYGQPKIRGHPSTYCQLHALLCSSLIVLQALHLTLETTPLMQRKRNKTTTKKTEFKLSLSLITLCHANICTIEIKLRRHDRRIVGEIKFPS